MKAHPGSLYQHTSLELQDVSGNPWTYPCSHIGNGHILLHFGRPSLSLRLWHLSDDERTGIQLWQHQS